MRNSMGQTYSSKKGAIGPMAHGSLFSGIGGFDLAAEWMGWENAFHCENNSFAQKVLKHYWPHAISYSDIKETDFTEWHGHIDVLSGGFPCQPYSTAGKRRGNKDARHLWPHMLRAIQEIRPTWIVGENVRGIVSWNNGLVFEEVCAQLEDEGYFVQPFILPAAGLNSPHRRERVWFVAYARCFSRNGRQNIESGEGKYHRQNHRWPEEADQSKGLYTPGINTYTNCNGYRSHNRFEEVGREEETIEGKEQRQEWNEIQRKWDGGFVGGTCTTPWEWFPTQSPLCTGDDGLPTELDRITFSKWRKESIKAGGNAIVPQVALQIFEAIDSYQTLY